jgi:transcriptional regulator of acetoin/glycerol metabolism
MSLEDLYISVSGRITQEVVNHQTLDWPGYFSQLRETIRRVAIDPSNGELSIDDRVALTRRLLAHVDALEKAWPNLDPK